MIPGYKLNLNMNPCVKLLSSAAVKTGLERFFSFYSCSTAKEPQATNMSPLGRFATPHISGNRRSRTTGLLVNLT